MGIYILLSICGQHAHDIYKCQNFFFFFFEFFFFGAAVGAPIARAPKHSKIIYMMSKQAHKI